MELLVSKYFFNICIQFPQYCTLKNNRFFTVFNNILNILNLCIDLLSLLRKKGLEKALNSIEIYKY
jgi:hypothetical protein